MNTITDLRAQARQAIQLRTALLLIVFPGFLFSQQVLQKEVPPEQPLISAGFHLGLSIVNVNSSTLAFPETGVNFSQLNRKINTTARFGVQFLIHFSPEYGLETGVNYEKGGLKFKGFLDPITNQYKTGEESTTTFSYEYVTIPLLYKRIFPLSKKTAVSLHAGFYFGFLESAQYGFKTTDVLVDINGNFTERNREFNFSLEDYSREVDTGIRLKLGIQRKVSELGTLYCLGHFSRGLRSVDDFDGPNGSTGVHQSFGVSLGGFFTMR